MRITIDVTNEQTNGALRVVIGGITIAGNPLSDGYGDIARRIGMIVLDLLRSAKAS
jgi:hypothetical protein